MGDKTYQPHDKDFKFKYKRMGVKIHNYLFKTDYKTIEFLDTVEAETGKSKDIVYTLDGKDSFHNSMSQPQLLQMILDDFTIITNTLSVIRVISSNQFAATAFVLQTIFNLLKFLLF